MSQDPQICRWCRWFQSSYSLDGNPSRTTEYEQGDCHRRSPRYRRVRGNDTAKWPPTEARKSCGDFERFRDPDGLPNCEVHA